MAQGCTLEKPLLSLNSNYFVTKSRMSAACIILAEVSCLLAEYSCIRAAVGCNVSLSAASVSKSQLHVLLLWKSAAFMWKSAATFQYQPPTSARDCCIVTESTVCDILEVVGCIFAEASCMLAAVVSILLVSVACFLTRVAWTTSEPAA